MRFHSAQATVQTFIMLRSLPANGLCMKKSLWLLGPTVAAERDVTKALLDVGFTVVGLSPRIQQFATSAIRTSLL